MTHNARNINIDGLDLNDLNDSEDDDLLGYADDPSRDLTLYMQKFH